MYFKKSPCIGVCEITPASPYCKGCMRDNDELSQWQHLSFAEKKPIWFSIAKRRNHFPGPSIIRDQLRRLIPVRYPITRIISLVPSITQTLYDLGLGPQVVGTTVFCPAAPKAAGHTPLQIGGTKRLNLERIRALHPDLIIANKEENIQEDVETLGSEFPVWISNVVTTDSALQLIWLLGESFDRMESALDFVDRIKAALPAVDSYEKSLRFAYFVWRKPWMIAAGDTYINAWLQHFGLVNCFAELSRYPEVTLNQVQAVNPEVILLPDEPFRFSDEHRQEMQEMFPKARIFLLEGKHTSWYGSLMVESIDYLKHATEILRGARPSG